MNSIKCDLSNYDSFTEWKGKLLTNLLQNQKNYPSCNKVWEHLADIVDSGDGSIYHVEGEGSITAFRWPNGEYKHVALIEDEIVGENSFWLKQYPFLRYDARTNKYMLKINVLEHKRITQNDCNLTIISHNAHYGHFIADDLPRLYSGLLNNKSIPMATPSSSAPFFASRELKRRKVNFRILSDTVHEANQCISYQGRVIHTYITDWVVKSLIVRKAIFSIPQEKNVSKKEKQISSASEKFIFVKRSRKFGSRIANLQEIEEFLERIGFNTVCLDELSLTDCKELFSRCKLAITKSGSTTLSTAISLKSEARLISLQPRRLFAEPTHEMLYGGLPYTLFYHPNITILLGDEVRHSHVQSSASCTFQTKELARLIGIFY